MLNVLNDQLVVDEKGIYSIEKFLIARRLMYWQVYLHRTVVASEQLLVMMLKRAKALTSERCASFLLPRPWLTFFSASISRSPWNNLPCWTMTIFWLRPRFGATIRIRVLSMLANGLVNRKLLSVELANVALSC